ncbi:MAG: ribose 1,5-bisphosphate isomerase [Nitrososphaerota archaeon]|jgi:ribose 1,5-bisphosphate isomerase|nr:ribose 1,5-bisphosphate isomerase [Nitrososphaerota archaeon]MDG7040557.1 ribose 1,5-bisphosphate isomerase [Nitrososphaerota archaeon]MDG7042034.1 ribose 1,5-bisphosphate isomerase [Nitrososphaerota archaeon]MDG7046491.1 ribose 1,5-bisphosphate isomerase [Nitrososphaerota archaeon]
MVEFSDNLQKSFNSIKTMKVRGAGLIARTAVETLKAEIDRENDRDVNAFLSRMTEAGEYLKLARPTAVSLPNSINNLLRQIQVGAKTGSSVGEIKAISRKAADMFIEASLEAIKKIGEIGSKRISDGDVLLTHCNSQSAIEVISMAHSQGKNIKVFVTETRPRYQGRLTAAALADRGLDITLIPDSAARLYMTKIDKVIVGADAIAANGAVINKIGTSQIAAIAKESRTRVMVAAETYKISPQTFLGELIEIEERDGSEIAPKEWLNLHPNIKVRNPAFDVTPSEYIDIIITEMGLFPPQGIILLLKDLYSLLPT